MRADGYCQSALRVAFVSYATKCDLLKAPMLGQAKFKPLELPKRVESGRFEDANQAPGRTLADLTDRKSTGCSDYGYGLPEMPSRPIESDPPQG